MANVEVKYKVRLDDEFMVADFNADSIVDILDIVQIVNYILDN